MKPDFTYIKGQLMAKVLPTLLFLGCYFLSSALFAQEIVRSNGNNCVGERNEFDLGPDYASRCVVTQWFITGNTDYTIEDTWPFGLGIHWNSPGYASIYASCNCTGPTESLELSYDGNFLISNPLTPTLTITATATDVFNDTGVQFTATPSGLGVGTPSYAWRINDVLQSDEHSSTFFHANWSDNDIVKAQMTVSGEVCFPTGAVYSNTITMSVNHAPVADAGADLTLGPPAQTMTLVGSGTDLDEDPLTYQWTQLSGPVAALSGATTSSLSLSSLHGGKYIFRLTVSDGVEFDYDDVTVLYLNDDAFNSIEATSFDENGTPYSRSKKYFDLSGSLVQTQNERFSQTGAGRIFATEVLLDRYNRNVGETLPAPIDGTSFGYRFNFIQNSSGEPYSIEDYDDPATNRVLEPEIVGSEQQGTLGWYYSANNNLEDHVPATGYPYSRKEFYEDGTGEVKRSASPGNMHRLGMGHETLGGTFPVYNELDDYLAKRRSVGLPDNKSAANFTNEGVQSVARDVNGTYAISITDKEGKNVFSARKGTQQDHVLQITNTVNSDLTLDPSSINYRPLTYFYILDEQPITITSGPNTSYVIEDLVAGTTYDPNAIGDSDWEPGFYRIILTSGSISFSYTNYYLDVSYQFYDDAGRLKYSVSPNGYQQWTQGSSFSVIDKTSYNYNYRGWLLSMTEPDAGTTNYIYRKDGSIRFSQNAQQAIDGHFSYTHYDKLGRPIESGEYAGSAVTFDRIGMQSMLEYDQQVIWSGSDVRDWVKTHYDIPASGIPNLPSSYTQEFVRGGVSWSENENISTWYSYDELGRVTWMAQKPNALDRTFVVQYQYDFLGNVQQVATMAFINENPTDQFYHHYEYDADKRLWKTFTSTDGVTKTLRATYIYYLHGPLKRIELGDKLQGIDFVYNINGWLKQINHPDTGKDPGGDGVAGAGHEEFRKDVFGMLFSYYDSEFDNLFQTSYLIPEAPNPNKGLKDYLDPIREMIKPAFAGMDQSAFKPSDYSVDKPLFKELLGKYYQEQSLSVKGYQAAPVPQRNIQDDDLVASSRQTVSLQMAAVVTRRFLIDFGGTNNQTNATGWNNITAVPEGTSINLITSDGSASGVSIQIVTAPSAGYNGSGNVASVNPQGYVGQVLDYPASACADSHFSWQGGGTYAINGLDDTKLYDLQIFAARSGVTDTRVGTYTINGVQLTLDAANNTSQTVQFTGIAPTNGTITLDFGVGTGSTFGYLNVLDITEQGTASPLEAPTSLTAQLSGSDVVLGWTDNASTEDGYKIERKLSTDTQFTEIGQVGANGIQYTDTNPAIGNYNYRVLAFNSTTQSAYSNTISIDVNIGDPPPPVSGSRRFLIDFGPSTNQTSATGWNNVIAISAGNSVNLVASDGSTSGISIQVVNAPSAGYNGSGTVASTNPQGYNSQVLDYPASACADSHFSWQGGGTYAINGLDNTKLYDLRIFAARSGVSDSRVGTYTINSVQLTLDAANNTSQTVQFTNIVPTNGTITMDFGVGSGSTFGYLNVLDIAEHGTTSSIAAPTSLAAQLSGSDVALSWTDNATNEDGYKLERKLSTDSQFTEIGQVNAGVTQYTDTNPAGDNTYVYRVFAFTSTDQSSYSNVVSIQVPPASTNPRRFLIDFGASTNQTSVTGWNNVIETPQGNSVSLVTSDGSTSGVSIQVITAPSDGFNGSGTVASSNPQGYNGQVLDYPASACADSHFSWQNGGTYAINGLDNTRLYDLRIFAARNGVSDTRVGTYTIDGVQLTLDAANNTSQTIQFTNIAPVNGTITLDFGVGSGSTFGYLNVLDITEQGTVPLIEAPTSLTALLSGSDVVLSWTDNAGTEDGYKIERKLSSETEFVVIGQTGANFTQYTDAGLANGIYDYRVVAFTATEQSLYSNIASIQVGEGVVTRRFLVDFGSSTNQTSDTGWNNVIETPQGNSVNLVTSDGSASGVSIQIVTAPSAGYNSSGTVASTNPQGYNGQVLDYPSTACADSHFSWQGGGTYAINGLDDTKFYDLQIFGARWTVSDARVGTYTINGIQFTLDAANNSSQTVKFTNIAPTNGTITLDFGVGAGSTFGYLNVLDITEMTMAPALEAPTLLSASLGENGILVSWEDNSDSETGFEIARASVPNGVYSVVGTTGANVTSFLDTSAPFTQTHYFRVRAIGENTGSPYSNVVSYTPVSNPPVVSNIGNQVVSEAGHKDVAFTVASGDGIPLNRSNVVILGSSTAAGTGASSPSNAWASLYGNFLGQYAQPFTLVNLALGGFTTEDILPSGDPDRNITKALTYNPLMIIINLPSNDVGEGIPPATMLANLATVKQLAEDAGVKVFITTTQPRNFTSSALRIELQTLANDILSIYGNEAISIYSELADPATLNIKAGYNSGDGIHVNDAGHAFIFQSVKAQTENFLNKVRFDFLLSQAPAFVTVQDLGSGNGTLSIDPGAGTIGNYNGISLTVRDQNGKETTQTFDLEVREADPLPASDYKVKPLYNGLITSTAWRTDKVYQSEGEDFSGMYLYDYDDKYQIREANWANPTYGLLNNSYVVDGNKFRMLGMDYDPNGNILHLKRYDDGSVRTNNFTYTYQNSLSSGTDWGEVQTNKLTSVNGYANAYTYNAIGQMIGADKEDASAQNQYVVYDVTGKVKAVYVGSGPIALNDQSLDDPNTPGNHRPVLDPASNLNLWAKEEDMTWNTITATDQDGDVMTFSLEGAPDFVWMEDVQNGTLNIVCSPFTGNKGYYDFLVHITDSHGAVSSYTVYLTVPGFDGSTPDDINGKRVEDKAPYGYTIKVAYLYDDRGFRLAKINYETKRTTWYIRDVSGNVLSIYEQDRVTEKTTETVVWDQLDNTTANGNDITALSNSPATATAVSGNTLLPGENGSLSILSITQQFTSIGFTSGTDHYYIDFRDGWGFAVKKNGVERVHVDGTTHQVEIVKEGSQLIYYQEGNELYRESISEPGTALKVIVELYKNTSGQFGHSAGLLFRRYSPTPATQTEIPIYGSGKIGTYYPQQDNSMVYEITDHLGNVRALLRENINVYTATMEDNDQEDITNPRVAEMQYFDNLFETEQTDARMNYSQPVPGIVDNPDKSAYLYWVDGTPGMEAADKAVGPSIALRVNAGDKFDIETWARFENKTSYTGFDLATLASLLGNTFASIQGFEGYSVTETSQSLLGAFNAVGLSNGTDNTIPYAYLNYVLYDKDMVPIAGDRVRVSEDAGFEPGGEGTPNNRSHEHLSFSASVEIAQDGYITSG